MQAMPCTVDLWRRPHDAVTEPSDLSMGERAMTDVDIGSVPDWLTAVAGGLALIFAARAALVAGRLLTVEQERDERLLDDQVRSQARQVTAWWDERDGTAGVAFRNASDAAVYKATVTLADNGPSDVYETSVVGTIPPSSEPVFRSYASLGWTNVPAITEARLELGFTDAQGNHWLRNGEGQLSQVRDQLVIWADANRRRSLEDFAVNFLSSHRVKVEVEVGRLERLFSMMRTETFRTPDIFITSHDRLAPLVTDRKVVPIKLADRRRDNFEPVCMSAATIDGELYALPYAMDTVALFTNLDLVEKQPGSIEELLSYGELLVSRGAVDMPLALPIAPDGEAFIAYPLLSSAFGIRDMFQRRDDSAEGLALDLMAPESIAALELFQGVVRRTPETARLTRESARKLFISGRVPFLISTGTTLRDTVHAPFPVGVSPVPGFNGHPPTTNITLVQLFVVGARGENPALSQSLLVDEMTRQAVIERLTADRPQLPALTAVLKKRIDADTNLNALHDLCTQGLLLPPSNSYPEVWSTLNQLETSIADLRSSIRSAARRAQSTLSHVRR